MAIQSPKTSWQIINSTLRVIRDGLRVKRVSFSLTSIILSSLPIHHSLQIVDEAIDATATHFNLRDAIEDFRIRATEANSAEEKQHFVERGQSSLLFSPYVKLTMVKDWIICEGTIT